MSYVKRETEGTYTAYTCKFCNNPATAEALSTLGVGAQAEAPPRLR